MREISCKSKILIEAIRAINPDAANIAEESIRTNNLSDEENDNILAYSTGISMGFAMYRMINRKV